MLREIDAYTALVQSEYRAYVYHVHEGRWIPGKAVSYLCQRVQQFIQRETPYPYEILVISMPPQHGKSMTVTESLPSWYLGKYPQNRVIEISYSEDFAQLFGRRNKAKIEQFGKTIFGISLAKSPNNNTEFELENNIGGMISRGILSGVTGRPANLMIIDDPIKNRQEADSETFRNRVYDEWDNSFKSRLAAGAKVIVIQTRWHEDDFAGRLIKQEQHVEVINLPCEAEKGDILNRPVGEALCPEIKKDTFWLTEFKKSYMTKEGSRAWNALFQGRPTSMEGNLIKREWWRYYEELPPMIETLMSVDATFKDGKDNDFVAIQVWGKREGYMYLIDAIKAHLNFPDTVAKILEIKRKHPQIRLVLVEDKANGSAIIQVLKSKIPGIVAVNPEGGKVARANAVSGAIESGNVLLPKYGPFTGDFIEECSAFPNGAHDDQVDCMTQALNRFMYFTAQVPIPKDEEGPPQYEEQVEGFLQYGG